MKRLSTYGLLLLTILASHFVVSACQEDVPETTDIMVTFTTRAISGGAASTAPEIEQMHDLRVIMLRSDGTIVGKDQYTPEGDFNPSSVRFTFSTTIPNPSGEDFTFLAIANETSIGQLDNLQFDDLSIGDKLTQSDIKDLTIGTDVNNEPIPQTDYWTVHVPQTQNHQVKETLKFAASKISVVFQNETKEAQSLSNIHITGITPNTRGYLFKQENRDDYIDSKLMDNGNAVSTISFGDLSLDAPNTNDKTETVYDIDSIPYYTYPLAEGNFNSPMLYATWGDETEPRTLDLSGITSLKRNEHLRIEITLTPAGDITVNYTIAEWEETPTNLGDTAPTTPGNDDGNGNDYYVDNWGTGGIIDVGGGGNDDPWANLGGEIIAGGKDVFENWEELEGLGKTNWLPIDIKASYLVSGYKIAVGFTIDSETIKVVDFYFRTPWNNIISGPITYEGDGEIIATLLLDNTSIEMIKKQQNGSPDEVRTAYHLIAVTFKEGSTQDAHNVTLTRMAIVDTNNK